MRKIAPWLFYVLCVLAGCAMGLGVAKIWIAYDRVYSDYVRARTVTTQWVPSKEFRALDPLFPVTCIVEIGFRSDGVLLWRVGQAADVREGQP